MDSEIQDGPFWDYYDNGQLSKKGTYKDGSLDGTIEVYHKNGQLERKEIFIDGEFMRIL